MSTPMNDERLKLIGIELQRGNCPLMVHELYDEVLRLRAEEPAAAATRRDEAKIGSSPLMGVVWLLAAVFCRGFWGHFLDEPWSTLASLLTVVVLVALWSVVYVYRDVLWDLWDEVRRG